MMYRGHDRWKEDSEGADLPVMVNRVRASWVNVSGQGWDPARPPHRGTSSRDRFVATNIQGVVTQGGKKWPMECNHEIPIFRQHGKGKKSDKCDATNTPHNDVYRRGKPARLSLLPSALTAAGPRDTVFSTNLFASSSKSFHGMMPSKLRHPTPSGAR